MHLLFDTRFLVKCCINWKWIKSDEFQYERCVQREMENDFMDQLSYELKQLCKRNKDSGFTTQKDRQRQLNLISRTLNELGYKNMSAGSLKPKHVIHLLQYWHGKDLNTGTIKNRMSVLRWWTQKINKPNLIPKDNHSLGIDKRAYSPKFNRAKQITQEQLDQIKDPYLKMSFQLQQAFGLRREECLKFQPSYADQRDHIQIKDSWAKGGRPRVVPILTEQQRELLQQAHQLVGRGSLIPSHKTYIQQRHAYDNQCKQLGLNNLHGVRHQYAQSRYQHLTGWAAPVNGGPAQSSLPREQYNKDFEARLIISRELGHNRLDVTIKYLGV